MEPHEHHRMTAHDHGGGHGTSWAMAAQATLHCLTGCAIGEVLGMVIGTAAGFHNAGTIVLSIVLAFVFGYALTMRGVITSGLTLGAAFTVRARSGHRVDRNHGADRQRRHRRDPGAMDAGLGNWLFWASLAFSLAVAFVVTTPVNRWMISAPRSRRRSRPPLTPSPATAAGRIPDTRPSTDHGGVHQIVVREQRRPTRSEATCS